MKFVKGILWLLVTVATLLVVGSFFLPSEQRVERSIVVNAEQADVFALINDYRQFNRWSPWVEKDPEAIYEFSGPDSGVGAKMVWRSEDRNVGNGAQEIIESQPTSLVRTKLTFEGFDKPSFARFNLEPADGGGTRVTWGFEANLDSIPGKYMGLMMEDWVGADYDNGLARLKELAENQG